MGAVVAQPCCLLSSVVLLPSCSGSMASGVVAQLCGPRQITILTNGLLGWTMTYHKQQGSKMVMRAGSKLLPNICW